MSDASDLDAARNLLATLEAGRTALLGLASTHLPFARALALHRSLAEGGADLAAAEEVATMRADLYWNAWRGAMSGREEDGPVVEIVDDQPTAAPPATASEAKPKKLAARETLPPRETPRETLPPRETVPARATIPPREVIQVDSPQRKVEPTVTRPVRETIQVDAATVRPEVPAHGASGNDETAAPGPESTTTAPPRSKEPPLVADDPFVRAEGPAGRTSRRAPAVETGTSDVPAADPFTTAAPDRSVDPPRDPWASEAFASPSPAPDATPEEEADEDDASPAGGTAQVRLDPVTESPLLEEIAREEAAGRLKAREEARRAEPSAESDRSARLPFEPISELDYVDDDPSEVTQVGQNEAPPLTPVGTIVPGLGTGGAPPARTGRDLIVDDFNEISELEELEPGEFGLSPEKAGLPFDERDDRPEVQPLPVMARRADDEEVLAQGDAPILPEFVGHQDDLSLSFEIGAGLLKGAPRLTDEAEVVPQPAPSGSRRNAAADQAAFQKALNDADTAIGRGDLTRAIQFYTDALDLVPENAEAFIGRGRCSLELGDYSSAMSDFQRAEDLSPDDPESHLAMGDLYYNRKEYKRAIDFYDEAVELDGQHAMAKCKRGLAHYYRKNYRQAFQDLQRSMALDPNIPNIHKYVQMALKKMDAKA